jgi:hypothetical protein
LKWGLTARKMGRVMSRERVRMQMSLPHWPLEREKVNLLEGGEGEWREWI